MLLNFSRLPLALVLHLLATGENWFAERPGPTAPYDPFPPSDVLSWRT